MRWIEWYGQVMQYWFDGYYHYWLWHEGAEGEQRYVAMGMSPDFCLALGAEITDHNCPWEKLLELRELLRLNLTEQDQKFVTECNQVVSEWEEF